MLVSYFTSILLNLSEINWLKHCKEGLWIAAANFLVKISFEWGFVLNTLFKHNLLFKDVYKILCLLGMRSFANNNFCILNHKFANNSFIKLFNYNVIYNYF